VKAILSIDNVLQLVTLIMDANSNFFITNNRFFYNQLKTNNQILTANVPSTERYCSVTCDEILVISNAPSLIDGRR